MEQEEKKEMKMKKKGRNLVSMQFFVGGFGTNSINDIQVLTFTFVSFQRMKYDRLQNAQAFVYLLSI